MVAKEYHQNIYRGYIQEKGTPDEIIKLLYTMLSENERFESDECMLIEGFLIAAKTDRYNVNINVGNSLEAHRIILADEESPDKSKKYSQNIINIANKPLDSGSSVILSHLVERIEMLTHFKFGKDDS